jgi:magnesium transporter
MALGEVRLWDWFRVIRREVFAGLVLGTVLAAIGSLIGVETFGTIAGCMLPLSCAAVDLILRVPPPHSWLTLVDVTGLIIYFTFAAFILRGTLL